MALFGVLYGSTPFYAIYGVFHVAATLALSAQIYYMGRWKLDWGIIKRIWLVKQDISTAMFREGFGLYFSTTTELPLETNTSPSKPTLALLNQHKPLLYQH